MVASWRFVLFCGLSPVVAADDSLSQSPGQTDVTDKLNNLITADGSAGIYRGGRGVIIRNINDGLTSTVVPCSLIVNDIISPSTMYPDGNPMCPNKGSSGFNPVGACDDNSDAFLHATVGAVMSNFGKLFHQGDDIQQDWWGYGVFYGTDANSADQRCRWAQDSNGYDCPGGWIPWGGDFQSDADKKGSGNYGSGNPTQPANLGGGGSGCHFSVYDKGIDQTDAWSNNENLVTGPECQCNYNLKGNWWQDWVKQWMTHAQAKKGYEWMQWFGGGKAPSFAVDMAACWVSNPRDMIMIQNAMWWFRDSWNNGLVPITESSGRRYWGWNEIPLDRATVNNPAMWDAVMVKLPAVLCGNTGWDDSIRCLSGDAQIRLEQSFDWYVSNNYLRLGKQNIRHRPGSYIVFLKEWWNQDSTSWSRGFYCESWDSPNSKYKIIYGARGQTDQTGACFIDKPAPAPTKTCTVIAPHRGRCTCNCAFINKPGACQKDDGSCCWPCCCKTLRSRSNQSSIVTVV